MPSSLPRALGGPRWYDALLAYLPTDLNAHHRRVILSHARWIARELPAGRAPPERRIRDAIAACLERRRGHRSVRQTHRRLHRVANLVWYSALRVLDAPLVPAPAPLVSAAAVAPRAATDRVFTPEEVARLVRAADDHSPQCGCLFRLLFTTGLRIAAARGLAWRDVKPTPDDPVARVAVVREKGDVRRHVPLTEDVRAVLARLADAHWSADGDVLARPPRTRAVTVRQLRAWWYRVCAAAGLSGPHCHPHTARHTVAHRLYHHGNPVAVIAKFLGHRCVATTDRYYLRLSFDELLARLRWPPDLLGC